MTRRPPGPVLLAVAAQVAILGVVAVPRLSVRLTGTEYRLRVRPVDPIDPFRGAYVDLRYVGFGSEGAGEGRAFITLRRDGDAWVGDRVTRERPDRGPYVACEGDGGSLKCGIESWFVSQDAAREAEVRLADGAVARVRISGSGRAVLVRVE
jgi:uncharacterized membrane-anchored protein